jgi:[acyl-carrier-protein] S-malonyltransferase
MNKTAILFPGGGTQYIGMGKAFYDEYQAVRELFEEAGDLLGYNLRKLCFEGDLEKLSRMDNSQPAIFTVSMAAYEVFKREVGLQPAFGCGHSLGEYAALACAGALSFGDALQMVKKRGELLLQAGKQHDATMMAVNKADTSLVEEECERMTALGGQVYIAVYNSGRQHVISGARKDIVELSHRLNAMDAATVILNIGTPSHCPLMADAAEEFRSELEKYSCRCPEYPVVSNVTALPYGPSEKIFGTLIDHMVSPVRWHSTINFLEQEEVTHVIELGPQGVLKNLIPYITETIQPYSIDITPDRNAIRALFGAKEVKLAEIIKKCIAIAVSSRNYNADETDYEQSVTRPYTRMRQLQELTEKEPDNRDYCFEAREILGGILDAKKIPAEEKQRRMATIEI